MRRLDRLADTFERLTKAVAILIIVLAVAGYIVLR
jgi:hypothetical protein